MSLIKALGKAPAGPRLQRILHSSHYRDGSFQNLVPTDASLQDTTMWKMLKEFRNKPADNVPQKPIPAVRTDLRSLPVNQATLVWFGHSSYLLKLGSTHILVDPVFSGNASPVSFFAKAYPGADLYKPADMPDTLEAILLTHDHYDHLDYKTVRQLDARTNHFYTSLGVGAHLEFWGIPAGKITELDWGETVAIDPSGQPAYPFGQSSMSTGRPSNPVGQPSTVATQAAAEGLIHLTATPARHFSGRTLKRGGAAWSSFVLNCPDPGPAAPNSPAATSAANSPAATSATNSPAKNLNLFLGGDSGYAPHFKSIGDQFGPFDLAILECGQYGVHWPQIHMFPEETVQAALDLKARILLPVHWAKFSLALHPWNEPIRRVKAAAQSANLPITTPRIGEPVIINHDYPMEPWYDIL
jgi:L-ascorbate metabolism protein UlaG (beta-lactamase superfamily)